MKKKVVKPLKTIGTKDPVSKDGTRGNSDALLREIGRAHV